MKKKWILIVALVLGAVIGGICFWKSQIWIQGRFYPRTSLTLDLRDVSLTVEDYQRIQEVLPQCRIRWQVPLSSGSVPSDARQITLRSLSWEDLEMLNFLEDLEQVEALDCPDEEALLALRRRRTDLSVRYGVAIGSRIVENLTEELTIDGGALSTLSEKLEHFPELTTVTVTQPLPEGSELMAFQAEHPHIRLSWSVDLGGRTVPGDAVELDLSGVAVDSRETLENALEYLPELKRLNLRGCGLSQEDMKAVALAYPQTDMLFDITVASVTVPTDIRELDLSGIPMEDTRELEAALPCFTGLERVIMCDTGISSQELDALGKRHPETRFVWTVTIFGLEIRTDATYYKRNRYGARSEELAELKYCVDMEAVDLGHMQNLDSCECLADMKKLKYLVLADTGISDLTPLSGMTELVYLEIFNTPVEDYSPLVSCPALVDLNLGGTSGDPGPLTQMPWLKHLWWSNLRSKTDTPGYQALELLPEALPNTEIHFEGSHPTASGWRHLPNYYAMRDALHASYMD